MKTSSGENKPFLKVPVLHERRAAKDLGAIDCLVYGYLLFLVRKGNQASQSKVCETLRLDRQSTKRSLGRLQHYGLVQVSGGMYSALDPQGSNVFRVLEKGKGEWWDRLIYDRVYLPQSSLKLTVRANLLFWHLVRMAEEVERMPGYLRLGGHSNRFYTHTYWATALGCDRKTAGTSMEKLSKYGLIQMTKYHKGYAIGIFPLKKNAQLWRDHWQKKPKVAPPLTAKELFAVPSPAIVEAADNGYARVFRILRKHQVTGGLANELAQVIVEEDMDSSVWIPMLKKAVADNYANWEDGKTPHQHGGFLFKYVLYDSLRARAAARRDNGYVRYTTSDEMRMTDALSELKIGQRHWELLKNVLAQDCLHTDDGALIPCPLDYETVTELAKKAKGSASTFKKLIVNQLVGHDERDANKVGWIRKWQQKEGEEFQDNSMLETLGVCGWQCEDMRKHVMYCLTGQPAQDTGKRVGQVNAILKVACWQVGVVEKHVLADRLRQRIEELVAVVAPKTAKQGDDEDRHGEISARTKDIGQQWLALSK
jgi:Mn-dependent DtxR family transcriptional regulator